jgi:adenosylhomocysteine nucleosidase
MLRHLLALSALLATACRPAPGPPPASDLATRENASAPVIVLVSANAEWKVVRASRPAASVETSPWGEHFRETIAIGDTRRRVVFFHGGWGKVAAAGSAQYCIGRWRPACVINLGTCGGIKGYVNRHDIVLAERTIIYDIKEAMGDSAQAIKEYETTIDLGWLTMPAGPPVRRAPLVSGDRDLVPSEIRHLRSAYGAIAADWESGAIAFVCARNRQRLLILRGVSDLVDERAGGEAYGNIGTFEEGTRVVMTRLLQDLPRWLAAIPEGPG